MTLPAEVLTREVTYTLKFTGVDPSDPSGDPITIVPAAGSSATFHFDPGEMQFEDLDLLPQDRTILFDSSGVVTAKLEETDNDAYNPGGGTWTVSFTLSGGMSKDPFSFQVPHDSGGATLVLNTVQPVSTSGGVLTTRGATGAQGLPGGTMTLTDNGDGTATFASGGTTVADVPTLSGGVVEKTVLPAIDAADIADSTTVGQDLMKAADAAAAQTAIGLEHAVQSPDDSAAQIIVLGPSDSPPAGYVGVIVRTAS